MDNTPSGQDPASSSEPAGAGDSPDLNLSSSMDGLIIVVLFILVRRFLGLPWAIGAVTLWSLKSAFDRKRKGLSVGKFLPIITLFIIARGAIGILTDSEAVYFGMGIATKMMVGVVLIGSVLAGRNLVARYAPLLFGFDEPTVAHPIYQHAMNRVAWVAGIYEIGSGLFDIWLFRNASVDGYLIVRFLANWGASAVALVGCFTYLNKALMAIPGFPGIMPMMEARMGQYEQAMRSRTGKRDQPE